MPTQLRRSRSLTALICCNECRYYLLASRPESTDTDFRWADLAARNNSELLKNLGNFVNRAVAFTCKCAHRRVPLSVFTSCLRPAARCALQHYFAECALL